MNIALVILHADPARGGAERYTVDLAAGLAKCGHHVSLLATSFGPPIESVHNIPLLASGATRLSRYLHFLDALDLHLESNPYDIVHAMLPVRRCDVYHPHAGLAVEAVASSHLKHDALLPRALSNLANRFNRKRQRFAAIEQRLLESARPPLVLCLSDYVKATVQKHYPALPADRLAKLFNSTDLARFDPAADPSAGQLLRKKFGLNEDHIIALMIAQDFERKGLRPAMQALAKVANPNLRLIVVGKQNPRSYQNLASALGISNRTIFAGPTTDPYSFYRAADFFVLPTRHDPCSLVVLESLAMGVPVISTVFNGACEIMQDGVHGFILPDPADVQNLASKYETLLDSPNRAEMSDACLALRPALSAESHLDRLIQLYELQNQALIFSRTLPEDEPRGSQ